MRNRTYGVWEDCGATRILPMTVRMWWGCSMKRTEKKAKSNDCPWLRHCVFRPNRPLIPKQTVHLFRGKPSTFSEGQIGPYVR